jgi:hypothetical protein
MAPAISYPTQAPAISHPTQAQAISHPTQASAISHPTQALAISYPAQASISGHQTPQLFSCSLVQVFLQLASAISVDKCRNHTSGSHQQSASLGFSRSVSASGKQRLHQPAGAFLSSSYH